MQLSKNRIKYLHSLSQKKFRDQNNEFLAEGERIVSEIALAGGTINSVVAESAWLKQNRAIVEQWNAQIEETDHIGIKQISTHKTPQGVVAVVNIPTYQISKEELNQILTSDIALYFDNIQDPGNMGTLLRIANWFGIDYVFVSADCVDLYNSKTIQASMGAICRVKTHQLNLNEIVNQLAPPNLVPVYGTFLEGSNIYTEKLSTNGIVVLGNEANGISEQNKHLITKKITIPSFGNLKKNIESLNVATAGAIVCSEFRRQNF